MAKYGYVSGPRTLLPMQVGNTGAIEEGDIVTYDGAGSPYIMRAQDAETEPIGVAAESTSAPTTDGDVTILVDVNGESIFRLPLVSGTLVSTEAHKECDIGVSGSTIGIDADTSTQDVIQIMEVESSLTTALCKVKFTLAGVV